jgi:hypothetical protein
MTYVNNGQSRNERRYQRSRERFSKGEEGVKSVYCLVLTTMKHFLSIIAFLLLLRESQGFSFGDMETRRASSSRVILSSQSDTEGESRRFFFVQAVSSVAFLGGLSSGLMLPTPAHAVSGLNKVNAKLAGYGLPTIGKVSDGLTPLLALYGKGRNRIPLLIQFNYPLTWVVTYPSNDANGEDGTVQAGEYSKGDTATLYVYTEPGHVDNIHSQPKELFEKAIIKCISQKGDNMYQNFKVTKLTPAIGDYDKQEYMLADFKYQLLTGAGFEVDRKGVASITSQGPGVQVLWAASTAVRYKTTEPVLRDIVGSFRCYADGLNFSEELFA